MSTTQLPAEQLVIISSRIRIWSGTIKVTRERDLAAVNGQLPPKSVMSDGRKTLVKSIHLAGLESVRKQVGRDLKKDGFSYVGCGTAVTQAKADAFIRELPSYERKFHEAMDDLVDHLDRYYDEMEETAGPWSSILKVSRLSGSQVRHRCHFGMNVFRMASPSGDPDSEASGLYYDTAGEALPALLESVAKDASDLLHRVRGKARMLQSQVAGIKHLAGKLKQFAFLDPRVGPVTAGMQSILDRMPVKGVLGEVDASICVAVLEQMERPELILQQGIGVVADALKQDDLLAFPMEDSEPSSEQETVAIVPPPKPAFAGFTLGM